MRKTVLFSIVVLLFAACNKDKYQTTPQLKFKSVNTEILSRDNSLEFTLSFTDAEGDLTDSIFIQKFDPACPATNFDAKYRLPEFPSGKNQAGDIKITFTYNEVPPKCFPRNDTAVFKFVLKDKAQNNSDTAVSPAIVILQ